MENDIVLDVKDIHLKYKFYRTDTLKQSVLKKNKKELTEFEALKGVSFQVERGINLGVIGSNGSGKSTLLRILAKTLIPDQGSVEMNAKSVSLLSLGVGFKPDLTGHENIYLNGLLLGLSQKELDAKMDEIVEFSGNGNLNYPSIGKENSPTRMKKKSPSCKVVITTKTTRMDSHDTYECISNYTETQEARTRNSGNQSPS